MGPKVHPIACEEMDYRFIVIFVFASVIAVVGQQGFQPSRTQTAIATSSTQDAPLTTTIHSAIPTIIPQIGAIFPPVGSIPQDFSPRGLQELWNIVSLLSLEVGQLVGFT